MASDQSYYDGMKKDFGEIIGELGLTDMQNQFMLKRWLDQLLLMEKTAGKAQQKYYISRIITIVGGVIVPVLVTQAANENFQLASILVGLIVAISAAIEQFFSFGERWRHYRRTAELLKSEGWKYFQLSDNYQTSGTHHTAYPTFVSRVEAYLQQDIEVFINKISKEKKQDKEEQKKSSQEEK